MPPPPKKKKKKNKTTTKKKKPVRSLLILPAIARKTFDVTGSTELVYKQFANLALEYTQGVRNYLFLL